MADTSLSAQRQHWIYTRGASGRTVRREATDEYQQRGGRRQRDRIAGRHAEELRGNQASSRDGDRYAEGNADRDKPQR